MTNKEAQIIYREYKSLVSAMRYKVDRCSEILKNPALSTEDENEAFLLLGSIATNQEKCNNLSKTLNEFCGPLV